MATTTVKKLKKEKAKGKFSFSSLLFALLALLMTAALFFGMIVLQNYLSEDVVYQEIIVAKTDIPENVIITAENAEMYLAKQQINVLNITKGALTSPESIYGQKTKVRLLTGEMLTLKDFANVNIYTDNMIDPVEISIGINSVADSDGGKIRAGDLINLTMMFTNEQLGAENFSYGFQKADDGYVVLDSDLQSEDAVVDVLVNQNSGTSVIRYHYDTWAQYVMEGLYVSKAYNADGVEITADDTESSVAMLIFVIEKADEPNLNNALMNCQNMRISKTLHLPAATENRIEGDAEEPVVEEETTEPVEEITEEPVEEEVPEVKEFIIPGIGPVDLSMQMPEEYSVKEREDYIFEGYTEVFMNSENYAVFVDAEEKEYMILSEGFTPWEASFIDEDGTVYKSGQLVFEETEEGYTGRAFILPVESTEE